MASKESSPGLEVSLKNTKQELLDAYNEVITQLNEKEKMVLKPEKELKERKREEILQVVKEFSTEGVVQNINNLKIESNKLLNQLSDNLEKEVNKLNQIKDAISIKEQELRDIYGIEKEAATLAALIETQHKEKHESSEYMIGEKQKFTENMANEKAKFAEESSTVKLKLKQEIDDTRALWKVEKEKYEKEMKEAQVAEAKKKEREKEEYIYAFNREKQVAHDKFEDEKNKKLAEKAKLQEDIKIMKEQAEKELSEREKNVAEKEKEFVQLQTKANTFPAELDTAVKKAVKDISEKLAREAEYKENLLKHQFEGEKNVLLSRIDSLEKVVKDQNLTIAKLSKQQEEAYQKVQDVAVKAIEGASNFSSYTSLQQLLTERKRKQEEEK